MKNSRSHLCAALTVLVTMVSVAAADAQVGSLTEKDITEIRQLSVTYRRALLSCHGEEYADLFATPGGYFSSGPRGEVRERAQLIEMVIGYDRCKQKPAAEPAAGGAPRVPATPPTIAWAPEGAKARIINTRAGGYYDDVYVRTPQGWRFKSRNVIADDELAAKLTTKDFVEVRELAGDDHGHYDNVYGEYGDERNYTPRTGPDDTRPFRSSGLRLVPTADGGLRGVAFLRNNGGRYDDLYVKTPDGWRIKQRIYTPPGGTPPAVTK